MKLLFNKNSCLGLFPLSIICILLLSVMSPIYLFWTTFELSCPFSYYDMSPIFRFEELPQCPLILPTRRFSYVSVISYRYLSSCFLVLLPSYGLQPFLFFLCRYFEILLLPVPPFNIPTQSYVRDFIFSCSLSVSNVIWVQV